MVSPPGGSGICLLFTLRLCPSTQLPGSRETGFSFGFNFLGGVGCQTLVSPHFLLTATNGRANDYQRLFGAMVSPPGGSGICLLFTLRLCPSTQLPGSRETGSSPASGLFLHSSNTPHISQRRPPLRWLGRPVGAYLLICTEAKRRHMYSRIQCSCICVSHFSNNQCNIYCVFGPRSTHFPAPNIVSLQSSSCVGTAPRLEGSTIELKQMICNGRDVVAWTSPF